MLDIDGQQLAQSNAILIYAGKLANLYPWDPLLALKVEEFLGNIDDVNALFRPAYAEPTDALKAAKRGEIAESEKVKGWFTRIDAALAKNGTGFVVGNKLTIADIRAFVLWTRKVDGVADNYFEQFPHIAAHKKLIGAHHKIKEYYVQKVHAAAPIAILSSFSSTSCSRPSS